ncbi:calbindin-32-like isoform X2 [Mizuhopecten yessoensis]|uniref:calbindin-32-like isoform X2 n=1 Tax=Mizuhopecten yessoensis TaxID=6573 RepID=UPI000B45A06F|nr:calbindin-32-like isoform X2 [Mizuhopecten yessoensis]
MAGTTDGNFLRQFRDLTTREFKQITANQFMDVWHHYDSNSDGYIEGKELDSFLKELVTSINKEDLGPEVVSESALKEAKELILNAFDENRDGKIDIAELAQILPTEENFLLLFRRDHPLDSSVEFMKVWREFDSDHSGFIEADELKNFLRHLLKQKKREYTITEEQLTIYTGTVLQLFDRNKDGKLQLSEMAKLLPVRENFLCRPVFKKIFKPRALDMFADIPCMKNDSANKMTHDDIKRVFNLYDRDENGSIENEELNGFLKDLMELVEEGMPAEAKDYDEEDLNECKKILLDKCDLNHDGKINLDELSMILMSYNRSSSDTECAKE